MADIARGAVPPVERTAGGVVVCASLPRRVEDEPHTAPCREGRPERVGGLSTGKLVTPSRLEINTDALVDLRGSATSQGALGTALERLVLSAPRIIADAVTIFQHRDVKLHQVAPEWRVTLPGLTGDDGSTRQQGQR